MSWVRMQRNWRDDPMFSKKPYTDREAFAWLIENAVYKETEIGVGGGRVTLQPGQLTFSIRFLAKRWGVSKKVTEGFLKRFRMWDSIVIETGTGQSLITICNYSKYQVVDEDEGDSKGTANGTARGQQGDSKGAKEETLNHLTNSTSLRSVEVPREKSVTKKRATKLPEDWMPNQAEVDYAVAKGLSHDDIRTEVERFRNHWHGNGKTWVRWSKVWQNWVTSPYVQKTKSNGQQRDPRGVVSQLEDFMRRPSS